MAMASGGTGTIGLIMGAAPATSVDVATVSENGAQIAPGGTFTPGSRLSLAFTAVGSQYGTFISGSGAAFEPAAPQCAGSLGVGREVTIVAPTTGPLTIVAMRAAARGVVTYETITLQPGAGSGGGGVAAGPPPSTAAGTPPPPAPSPTGASTSPAPAVGAAARFESSSPDGRFTVRWQPAATFMSVSVTARAAAGSLTPPRWVGFARSENGAMLGDLAGGNIAIVGMVSNASGLAERPAQC